MTRHEGDVLAGIYTIPEISSVGKTERKLSAGCIPFAVGRAFFKDTARRPISGEGNTLRYFISTTFSHPTMTEAYSIAALNKLNRLTG